MSKAQKSVYGLQLVSIAPRRGRCSHGSLDKATQCENKTRLLCVVVCSDIEDDGSAGYAVIRICPEHIETALITLAKEAGRG